MYLYRKVSVLAGGRFLSTVELGFSPTLRLERHVERNADFLSMYSFAQAIRFKNTHTPSFLHVYLVAIEIRFFKNQCFLGNLQ